MNTPEHRASIIRSLIPMAAFVLLPADFMKHVVHQIRQAERRAAEQAVMDFTAEHVIDHPENHDGPCMCRECQGYGYGD